MLTIHDDFDGVPLEGPMPFDDLDDILDPLGESEDDEMGSSDHEVEELVERIRIGDPKGLEDLYRIFSRGVRFYLCRQLESQELEDKVHDVFLIVVDAIRNGELREPDRLMGYIRTVVRRQIAAHIDNSINMRRDALELENSHSVADFQVGPEEHVFVQQKAKIMERVLRGLNNRDREILTRFYLHEEPFDRICEDMGLSVTQFRLLKSRAKTRLRELGKKKLSRRPIRAFFLRTSASA